jgi:hypothetical protein
MDPAWFEEVLYPLRDEVLAVAARVESGFYLTGGTALGRVHLRHRYSEDLDLFVNDDDRFQAWADRLLEAWRAEAGWRLDIQRRDPRFVRALVSQGEVQLKVEFVNDVRGRVGTADDWRLIRWIPPPPPCEEFLRDLRALGEDLLLLR